MPATDEAQPLVACAQLHATQRRCFARNLFSKPAAQARKCGPAFAAWRDCVEAAAASPEHAKAALRTEALERQELTDRGKRQCGARS